MSSLNIVMVQMNTLVGDFEGNTAQVIEAMRRAEAKVAAPVLVFPELTLSGYPPEDLLLRPSIELRVNQSLQAIKAAMTGDAWLVIGYPRREGIALYNVAAVLHGGEIVAEYRKQCLPNYQVFDEMRYFQRGDSPCVVQIQGIRVGLTVCEDIWEPGPVRDAAQAGAELVLNLNASPYHRGKRIERWELVAERASSNRCPIVYVNQVGGQDELVFDGGSFAVDDEGERVVTAPNFV
ncbi:MAG TPA: NAD+ synthase, partial [Halieaceae bacterium]|nr:NAD+ synthase [Halieaceae bacterium]